MSETYKAAVIGCGSIGALKDDFKDMVGQNNPLTHAGAIHKNPNIDLIAVIDNDTSKSLKASV